MVDFVTVVGVAPICWVVNPSLENQINAFCGRSRRNECCGRERLFSIFIKYCLVP